MIVFVHFEHARLRKDPLLWRYFATAALETKYRLEEIAGDPCLMVRYDRLTPALLHNLKVRALVVGGNYTGFQHFRDGELAGVQDVFRQADWPTLAICGGLQLMAKTYGGEIGPMDPSATEPGQDAPDTDTPIPPDLEHHVDRHPAQSRKMERGFVRVRMARAHPLFGGMGRELTVFQLHGGEVKVPPDGFWVLAENEACHVQAMAHKNLPLFGTQFHPELYDASNPDGRRILRNFFRMADVIG